MRRQFLFDGGLALNNICEKRLKVGLNCMGGRRDAMSWQTINEFLGLATIDPNFCQALLKDPLSAIRQWGFKLTAKEEHVLKSIHAEDIAELSQKLIDQLHDEHE